jgi:MarR family transcriptional regulator for hemolysin
MERYFFVLKLIAKSEFITQQCLANGLKIDKAGIVRMIDYLSEKALVKREVNPNDRREHRIVATKKGLRYVAKIESTFDEINEKAFSGFNKTEKKQFLEMCQRINENLQTLPSTEYSIIYSKN